MRSPLLFLGFVSLAQLSACDLASSREIPTIGAARAAAVGATLLFGSQPGGGYKYTSSDGSYSIKFPGKPSENLQTVQTKLGPIKALMVSYQSNQGRRAYISSSTQYKVDSRSYNVEKGLDGARDGAVRNTNATLSNETRIKYKGVPGRQFYLTTKQGMGKVRIYLVNSRKGPTIYQEIVIDTTGKVDDARVNTFLDSLTFKTR